MQLIFMWNFVIIDDEVVIENEIEHQSNLYLGPPLNDKHDEQQDMIICEIKNSYCLTSRYLGINKQSNHRAYT